MASTSKAKPPKPIYITGRTKTQTRTLRVAIGIVAAVLLATSPVIFQRSFNVGGWGKASTATALVSRVYADGGTLLVDTDMGTFEVANGLLRRVRNAAEMHAMIKPGGTYLFELRGSERDLYIAKFYPCIISAGEIAGAMPKPATLSTTTTTSHTP
jgi:hypothetical protein